ncbi:MAG TPA: helix-turn-helix domain-containing protein [Bdellovibrionota bacterium]|nr:helix-turn-helix domain-containing protein [Bdellovibrionota bacterium]
MIRYQAKIYKDGTRYSVEFPDLPGCFSDGATRDEARRNAREAMSLYLEEARDPKWDLPRSKVRRSKRYEWVTPYEDVLIPLLIRQERRRHGLTQKELAKRIGITFQQLQKLETPGKSNPTVKTLVTISEALGENIDIRLAA